MIIGSIVFMNAMTLFKYIRPERFDVIQDLEIRFTQPDALNDPFELHPPIDSIVAEADVLANLSESPIDLRPMVAQAYAMIPGLKAIPIEVFMRAVEEFMATEDARNATAEGLRIFLTTMRDGAAPIRDAIYRAFNENVGILSLSEIPNNEPMWAHYAADHKGLVLCFDEQHSFFHRRRSENDEFFFVRKVKYNDGPPLSLATVDGDALLVTKSSQWAYEREWRMLVPLNGAARSIPVAGDMVHVFAFPPAALTGIIFGARASAETEAAVRNALSRRPELQARLARAIFDLGTRTVNIRWLDGND